MPYGTFTNEAQSVWDFARCQRSDGSVYGTGGKCRIGTEIGAKVEEAAKPKRGPKPGSMRLTAKIQALSAADLQKVLKDPRLNDKQRAKLESILKEKQGGKKETPKAEPKKEAKPKLSKEDEAKDKVRKEWENEVAKIKEINRLAEEARQAAKQELGHEPMASTDRDRKVYDQKLKERGLTVTKVAHVADKRKELENNNPWLKAEITARRVKENEENWKNMSKDEKRALIKDQMERAAKRYKDIDSLNQNIKNMNELMKGIPEFNTPDNRAAVIALRAQRAKLFMESAEERRADRARIDTMVKDAPTYKTVPGSSKPLKKADPQEIAKELEKVAKEHENKAAEYDLSGKSSMANAERGNARMARQSAENFRNGYTGPPPQEIMYRMQGYNAKPELVKTREELNNRKDLINGDDGKPLTLWRGVTAGEFSDQFKGGGPDGNIHYAGKGIYGNGTYAASHAPGAENLKGAFSEAKSYAGWSEKADLPRRMTAFALRADANVVQFEGADWRERGARFDEWKTKTLADAQAKTGYTYYDVGEAATALGIHAYRVPQGRDEDFWVVLNRGAIVAAADPQIDDML